MFVWLPAFDRKEKSKHRYNGKCIYRESDLLPSQQTTGIDVYEYHYESQAAYPLPIILLSTECLAIQLAFIG